MRVVNLINDNIKYNIINNDSVQWIKSREISCSAITLSSPRVTSHCFIQPEEDEYNYDNDNKSPMYDNALLVARSGFRLFTVLAGGLQ